MANEGTRGKGNDNRNTGDQNQNTSRTSNQGRKLASGGDLDKRGDPEIDEDTNSPKSDKSGKERVRRR